jgi:hypothetical protein
MKNTKEHNYYKWSIAKGDYTRDEESTISFQKKLVAKRRLRTTFIIILYFAVVATISYFIVMNV